MQLELALTTYRHVCPVISFMKGSRIMRTLSGSRGNDFAQATRDE